MNINRLKRNLTVAAGVLALAVIGTTMAPSRLAADKPNDVNVVNNVPVTVTNNPLPVSGAVSVTNTPTVNIGNSPTVGLVSNATVRISNTNTTPVFTQDVDNAGRQPFQGTAVWTITDGFAGVCGTILTVPSNKKAVIEFVSAFIIVPGGQNVYRVQFIDRQLSGDITHELHPVATVGSNYNVDQQLRVYADSNSLINLCPFRDQVAGQGSVLATVSGYLVNP